MDIARVTPALDEMAAGLLGRIAYANACPDLTTAAAGLRVTLGMPNSSWLMGLAAHLGQTPAEFSSRHTLVPVTRAVSTHVGTDKEAKVFASFLLKWNHVLRPGITARYCPDCVRDDAQAGHGSYWRRLHHLPMVDWCQRHRAPLVEASPLAFMLRPGEVGPDFVGHRLERDHDLEDGAVLSRFFLIQQHWLGRQEPLSSVAIQRTLQEGCRRHGLRSGQTGNRPLLTDMARDVVPLGWLKRHMPEVANKSTGAYVARVDGAAKDKHVAYSGPTCAFALAVLFDSPSEALAVLEAHHEAIVRAMRSDSGAASASIEAAGLAFIKGESIGGACKAHNVSVDEIEGWLRAGWQRRNSAAVGGSQAI